MIYENIVLGKGTKYPLKGMLTLPEADTPVPAVILVHGSGSSNMDEKVGKLTPFRDLAEGLAAHGIASIRYDKRSFAHPLRMVFGQKEPITVRQETIEDALLAAKLLRQDSRIDHSRIFLIGHSMGAMLAPRIDAEGGDFAGLILLAGTPRRIEEVLQEQIAELLSEMPAIARKSSEKKISKLMAGFDGLYDMTDEEAQKKKFGGGTTMYYFKEMGEHPAPMYLEKTDKPILILQGEKDFQVKADRDFRAYRDLLGDRENVIFRIYPDLNHAFVPSVYGKISKAKQEYNVRQHIPETVTDDIAKWIHTACTV